MAKFSGASQVQAAQEGQLGSIDLPTQTTADIQAEQQAQQQAQPAPSQAPEGSMLAELQNYQAPAGPADPASVAEVQQGVDQGIGGIAAEVERQRIPSINERAQGGERVDRWLKAPVAPLQKPNPIVDDQSADAGIIDRAKAMANNINSGNIGPMLSGNSVNAEVHQAYKEGESGPAIADKIALEKEGTLLAALERANAMTRDANGFMAPDPRYTSMASAVTENKIFEAVQGDTGVGDLDPVSQAIGEGDADPVTTEGGKLRPVTHAEGNAGIGQQIHAEWQRIQGNPEPQKLPGKEAETLGATFKELWAIQNPKLVNKSIDPATNQYVYQLSAMGENVMAKGTESRKRLFPKKHVKPSKQPLPTGKLLGDTGANAVKRSSGSVGKQDFSKTINNAMTNLANVPNVVDKQRTKILYSTILPTLQTGDHNTWMAEINNFGPGKIAKFDAAAKQQQKRREEAEAAGEVFNEDIYDPQANMAAIADKIAQEVRAVAQERKGANFLSYNVQGFQGRISPQQSFFDPTTSKAVRFVTRNATPSIAKPGSRVEKNLRQMYAMMLVKGADSALPEQRDIKLEAATPQLEAWGKRLSEVLENTMSDAEYEAISEAIDAGIPLTDPKFPEIKPLGLDPQKDAELIKNIESKGEDGPHFIDGLIDFVNYRDAKKAGKPHSSYFNAYIDGKTNGIASNAIQMGNIPLAERTGVLRDSRVELLDEGDVRAQLKDIAINSINEGWDGHDQEIHAQLSDVAEHIYGYRDLNKATTMTFGYGKEIESFASNMEEALAFLGETQQSGSTYNESLAILDQKMSRSDLAHVLMSKYAPALEQVMSSDALETRSLMRGAAALHSATNTLMSITGPTGMDLNLGGDVSTGYENAQLTRQKFKTGDGKTETRNIAHYESEATSVAGRSRINPETGQTESTPGEKAYGGSVVAPVQALDAATVALSASGKAWDRLSQASGGNPYMHTIYDAFKLDANGFDVALEEINKSWLDASMNWNYLEETKNSTQKTLKEWNDKMKNRDQNEEVTENEAAYMKFFMDVKIQDGKADSFGFKKKMPKFKKYPDRNLEKEKYYKAIEMDLAKMTKALADVGYDTGRPPEKVTVRQVRTFVNSFASTLGLGSRMSAKVDTINNNKKKLKEQILKRGYKTPRGERIALQYYAH